MCGRDMRKDDLKGNNIVSPWLHTSSAGSSCHQKIPKSKTKQNKKNLQPHAIICTTLVVPLLQPKLVEHSHLARSLDFQAGD